MTKIGYQDGLKAAYNRIKKLDPAGCNPNYNPDNPEALPTDQLKAWDKVHRTLKILKEDHDASIPSPPPGNGGGNGGEEPSPIKRYAPRTHNLGAADQDPRFCCKPEYGVVDKGSYYEDEMGCWYDKEHMWSIGGPGGYRDRNYMVPGLKGAESMDGMEPCDPYSANGISVPPYPGDPYAQTGSYHR